MNNNITRGDFGRAAPLKRKKRTSLFIILIVIIAITMVIFASPLFYVKEIKVSGISRLTPEYVKSASGIKVGEHLVNVHFSEVETVLSKTTYISSPKIIYHFPNKIEISIVEKMPVVYYSFADGYVGISTDGYVTDIIQKMTKPLPVAKGITLSSYSIGKKPHIGIAKSGQIECLTKVADELYHIGISSEISYIDVSRISNIILKSKNGLTIKCGNTEDLNYKLSILKEVIPKADHQGIVDISSPGQATYEMT
ncbi:MAG: FtsQ-type POTRA domain-containing protein [Bacillota bacterium]|nr:FtsQ-type POTRA domain-containing protein [Bacillota bacterium]